MSLLSSLTRTPLRFPLDEATPGGTAIASVAAQPAPNPNPEPAGHPDDELDHIDRQLAELEKKKQEALARKRVDEESRSERKREVVLEFMHKLECGSVQDLIIVLRNMVSTKPKAKRLPEQTQRLLRWCLTPRNGKAASGPACATHFGIALATVNAYKQKWKLTKKPKQKPVQHVPIMEALRGSR